MLFKGQSIYLGDEVKFQPIPEIDIFQPPAHRRAVVTEVNKEDSTVTLMCADRNFGTAGIITLSAEHIQELKILDRAKGAIKRGSANHFSKDARVTTTDQNKKEHKGFVVAALSHRLAIWTTNGYTLYRSLDAVKAR